MYGNKVKWSSLNIEQRDKRNINSMAFAFRIINGNYLINYYTTADAIRIGITNTLELFVRLFICSMITKLHL